MSCLRSSLSIVSSPGQHVQVLSPLSQTQCMHAWANAVFTVLSCLTLPDVARIALWLCASTTAFVGLFTCLIKKRHAGGAQARCSCRHGAISKKPFGHVLLGTELIACIPYTTTISNTCQPLCTNVPQPDQVVCGKHAPDLPIACNTRIAQNLHACAHAPTAVNSVSMMWHALAL